MTKEELQKMETCSYLLPDPGGEVVRNLIEELHRVGKEANDWENKCVDLEYRIIECLCALQDMMEGNRWLTQEEFDALDKEVEQ